MSSTGITTCPMSLTTAMTCESESCFMNLVLALVPTTVRRSLNSAKAHRGPLMPTPEPPSAETFAGEAESLLESIERARKRIEGIAGLVVAALDVSLRKARKRDFYGARKAWRKLDKLAQQGAEVRQLQGTYRESYKGVEARIRQLQPRSNASRKSRNRPCPRRT